MWSINSEEQLNSFLDGMRSRGGISISEQEAISEYVSGIFDALDNLGIHEEDLN